MGGALLALGTCLALAGPAMASGDRLVQIRDACDPTTFNAALQDPTVCVRPTNSGRFVTFDDFVARLIARGSHNAWRFDRGKVTLRAGDTLTVEPGTGGEFHTFSEVPRFGPGCLPQINELIFPPDDQTPVVPDCTAAITASGVPRIPAGFRLTTTAAQLGAGTHLFQCLIHPWMRTVVTVR